MTPENPLKRRALRVLRWSERYTKTDMVYFVSSNFWLTGGRLLAVMSGLALTVVLANALDPTTFGIYKYVLAGAAFIAAFSLTGLNPAVARAVAQGNRNIVPHAFRMGVLWSLPASLIALGVGAYYLSQGNVPLGVGFLLVSLTTPLTNNLGMTKAVFQGLGDFKTGTLYWIPRALFPVAALIATVLITENVVVILCVYFLSNALAAWALYRATIAKANIQDVPQDTEEVSLYGKHMSVLGFLLQVGNQIDQLLLWHFAGPVQLAIYAFALAPVREFRNFSENFFPIIFPKFAARSVEELRTSIPLRTRQMLLVCIGMALVYFVLAPTFFAILFPQYLAAVFASQLLALGLVFQPRGVMETAILTHGKTRLRYYTVVSSQVIKIALLVVCIPLWGIMGAVVALLASDAIATAILYAAYRKL